MIAHLFGTENDMTQHEDTPVAAAATHPGRRIFLRGAIAGTAAAAGLIATGAGRGARSRLPADSRTTAISSRC